MAHSQPAWETLSSKLPRTLPIALDGTLSACLTVRSPLHSMVLPACLTVRSQVSSQVTPKYTSESLSSTLPIALDGTLPAYSALRSQVHSQEGRHSQSHLTLCSHVRYCMLDPETCWFADASLREASGWCRMLGSEWRAACGVWRVARGVCWPKSWRRSIW